MLDRFFRLSEHQTTVRTELLAGLTTFLTMAYIIVVQPAVLSGEMLGWTSGMDFGAVAAATCISAALATAVMGLYARLPIAQAPGMGENFFFVLTLLPAGAAAFGPDIAAGATTPWRVGRGVIFVSGVWFLALSLLGVRQRLLEAISPSMQSGIAVGIGLFIAFIGLRSATLVLNDPGTALKLNPDFASPDLVVLFIGFLVTSGLHARRVSGSIILGIVAASAAAAALKYGLPLMGGTVAQSHLVAGWMLMTRFEPATALVAAPPSIEPTFWKLDLARAIRLPMLPFVLIFLFMNLFDTLGTLIGVGQQAGLVRDGRLVRARQALVSDAVGTVAGAALGTSTVVSFIESAAGVEQGGRTGLTALVVAALFLAALAFGPLIAMVGS